MMLATARGKKNDFETVLQKMVYKYTSKKILSRIFFACNIKVLTELSPEPTNYIKKTTYHSVIQGVEIFIDSMVL